MINDFDLPREGVPTQWFTDLNVWDAVLQRRPLTALVRNLGKMPAVGLVKPFSQAAGLVVRKLKDEPLLKPRALAGSKCKMQNAEARIR